jgi:hypothetical protein
MNQRIEPNAFAREIKNAFGRKCPEGVGGRHRTRHPLKDLLNKSALELNTYSEQYVFE